jgi:hypothetical protein
VEHVVADVERERERGRERERERVRERERQRKIEGEHDRVCCRSDADVDNCSLRFQ